MKMINEIMETVKQLTPANMRKVLIYARTLKTIQDERKAG